MNDKLQSTIEPNCLPTISHFSLSLLVTINLVIFGNIGINMNINLKFVHQCCCLALIYKPKGARTATRQRRWPRKDTIIAGFHPVDPLADADGVVTDAGLKLYVNLCIEY